MVEASSSEEESDSESASLADSYDKEVANIHDFSYQLIKQAESK